MHYCHFASWVVLSRQIGLSPYAVIMPHRSMQSDLKLVPRVKKSPYTKSPFDTTDILSIRERAGSNVTTPPEVEVSAFSLNRKTTSTQPQHYLRKHTGRGGMLHRPNSAGGSVQTSSNRGKAASKYGAFAIRPNPPNTEFRRFYERGDLPIMVDHGGVHNRIAWKVDIQKLDFHHYLPIFFDGLREEEEPYAFLAEQGVYDMLTVGPGKVLPVIPQIIIPLKTGLNTRRKPVIVKVLKVLQKLVQCDSKGVDQQGLIGQALVPYYRQLLPVLNLFVRRNTNLGDNIDYHQHQRDNLGDLIMQTLEAFEVYGGEDAFINLKYLIPTYQSVIAL